MNILEFVGKDEQTALEKALNELNVSEKDVIYKFEKKKGKLFKAATCTIKIINLKDIIDFSKKYLKKILENMGLKDINFESSIKNNTIYIKMFSDNNALLIGKSGNNLKAIQTYFRQVISTEINMAPKIILDVENYKDKQNYFIEKAAKEVAREVKRTKVAAALEDMNSYQRRIVHNALTNFKGIKTESEGTEPHRHIVIKPKEDK